MNNINRNYTRKTCTGCVASKFHNYCSLGYSCNDYTPLESCPKPKTLRQLSLVPASARTPESKWGKLQQIIIDQIDQINKETTTQARWWIKMNEISKTISSELKL